MQKLYVLTRYDISPGQQAVQSSHAVAEFMLQHETTWDNGTIVMLGIHPKQIEQWEEVLELSGLPFSSFHESDISEKTAIAFVFNDKGEPAYDKVRELLKKFDLLFKKKPTALERFIQDQKPLPQYARKVLEDNFWELI